MNITNALKLQHRLYRERHKEDGAHMQENKKVNIKDWKCYEEPYKNTGTNHFCEPSTFGGKAVHPQYTCHSLNHYCCNTHNCFICTRHLLCGSWPSAYWQVCWSIKPWIVWYSLYLNCGTDYTPSRYWVWGVNLANIVNTVFRLVVVALCCCVVVMYIWPRCVKMERRKRENHVFYWWLYKKKSTFDGTYIWPRRVNMERGNSEKHALTIHVTSIIT